MPDLAQSLLGRDLGHLQIVAELWGGELEASEARAALQQLVPALVNRKKVEEMAASLPAEARMALDDLAQNGGRLPWPLFTRRYGAVREMGAARRDRDKPYLNPVSPAEMLWYRALAAKAFFDDESGPREYAYIPNDLLALLPASKGQAVFSLGRPATPAERGRVYPAHDHLLDHACTLLAALRLGLSSEEQNRLASGWECDFPQALSVETFKSLLSAAGLLDENGLPHPETARSFLEAPRGEALARLASRWEESQTFNELRMTPHLEFEGTWENDPLLTRRFLLGTLSAVPRDAWWNLASLATAIRQAHPDFQRPAGDYDSWFIRDEASGEFLRGFEHWDQVDGALIRYLVTGPLHWLGIVELAGPEGDDPQKALPPAAFRFTPWAEALLAGNAPAGLSKEEELFVVRSDGRVHIPRLSPRAARYQMARFCSWEGEKEGVYRYRLAPASLERARQQGLTLAHLMSLLRRNTRTLPPNLLRALERWEQHGIEASLEQAVILRLASPDLLQKLRSSSAARFLGDPLGPTTVIVKPGAVQKIMGALMEIGYLGDSANLDEE